MRSAIDSIAHYLPGPEIKTEDINRRILETTGFELTNGLIERLTGVSTRHYRAPKEQCSDLAVEASRKAIERAGVSVEDIDLVVFASCTQDIIEPATANIVQEKLGCRGAQAMDVKNACNSFLNGLDVADSHIRAGKSRCALVTVGETLSLSIDWQIHSADDLKSRLASLTLGDAGAACILTAVPEDSERGIQATGFRSYGDKWRLATVLGGGSMYQFDPKHAFFHSESGQLRSAALELIPGVVNEVLGSIGWEASEVDVGCGHQVTKEIVESIRDLCGIQPGREIVTVTDCGNTAAASVPLCLSRAYDAGKLKPGAKILLIGGAAGFSVGVIPVVW
ncbi:MAG: 3-oxoacyl-ACP synthase III family protein, partial [Planctomycetota bacterium]|jgi:3-oxoacyl-[acyl-carrier-protein] synthase-3